MLQSPKTRKRKAGVLWREERGETKDGECITIRLGSLLLFELSASLIGDHWSLESMTVQACRQRVQMNVRTSRGPFSTWLHSRRLVALTSNSDAAIQSRRF